MRSILWMTLLVGWIASWSGSAVADDGDAQRYAESYALEASGDVAGALRVHEQLRGAGYVHHLRRGWLLYLSGRHVEAVASYERAVAAEPRAIEPLVGLALPQMALRRWADAEQTTRAALELDPDNYLAASRRALSLYSLGRYADAAVPYQRMLALYPSDVEMRAGLGWCLLRQGKKAEARARFEEVLGIAPAHPAALEGLRAARP
jgi:tetratricopeptide (TPR) repeat protein